MRACVARTTGRTRELTARVGLSLALVATACSSSSSSGDAGASTDGSHPPKKDATNDTGATHHDGGHHDSGHHDSGNDTGAMGSPPDATGDAGTLDSAVDATPDSGPDAPIDTGVDAPPPPPAVPVDVLTQHNDATRSGQNLHESVLTTANVKPASFGMLFKLPVEGLVYAQPLIVTGYPIAGVKHDLLIVATAHNVVYAFDANTAGPPLWQISLGTPVPSSAIKNGAGTLNIPVEVGILATPAIDRANGLIYVTCKTYVDSTQGLFLHALDLGTGADVTGSPVAITATAPGPVTDAGTATLTLDAPHHAQRPGLLLQGGTVYLAFASHEDWQPYHGWILGYRYDLVGKQFTQSSVFNTSGDGIEAGIWQSGQGVLGDGQNVYAATGNGTVTVQDGGTSYGESFFKLTSSLGVQDWFVPVGYGNLNRGDVDLGAGGPLLLPGTNPPLLVGGGKQGLLYLVDTSNMGHLGNGSDQNLQEFQATRSIFGAPVAWTGSGPTRLYLWGVADVLKQWTFSNGTFDPVPSAEGTTATVNTNAGNQAGNLAVTSNGAAAGTGIVWGAIPLANPNKTTVAGMLYAYDALTLAELWNSHDDTARDDFGNFAKFVAPTVANGKVYLATHSQQVVVYGLLGQ